MKILALETSSELCSVALSLKSEILLREQLAPQKHTELVLQFVNNLLCEAGLSLHELDAIAYGKGPGSFTGVRIASGVAQGLAYSGSLPVIGVSSLATLACSLLAESEFIAVATDARMGEIYHSKYSSVNSVEDLLDVEELLIKPNELELDLSLPWHIIGNGWHNYSAILSDKYYTLLNNHQNHLQDLPSAQQMIPLAVTLIHQGLITTAENAMPVYLRNKVTG